MFQRVLGMIPDAVLILNPERQIVFHNEAFIRLASHTDPRKILGLRPGEAFQCIHSDETQGGCGTTVFCRECGAPKAILKAQAQGHATEECRIAVKSGDALDVRVWTTRFELGGKTYIAFAVTDTSHENRRRALERIFFHDVLNTASGLRGLTEVFSEASAEEKVEVHGMIQGLSNRLIDEIQAQRELAAAESGDVVPKIEIVNSRQIIDEVADTYRHHDVAKGKTLRVDDKTVTNDLGTDKTLLRRVVGNMTKNALEASGSGDTVTLGCDLHGGEIEFWVHNPSVMPESVKLQVFQRSFSTKGSGRGLGTYSMRLLTEKYLRGKVSFTSEHGKGTRFMARLPSG